MGYSNEDLKRIFDRTDGRCHLCGTKRSFRNYAQFGRRGGWEIDHAVPRSKGGSDHRSNLYVACISHNRSRGSRPAKNVRSEFGLAHAPMSRWKREERENQNTWNAALTIVLVFGGLMLYRLIEDDKPSLPAYPQSMYTPISSYPVHRGLVR